MRRYLFLILCSLAVTLTGCGDWIDNLQNGSDWKDWKGVIEAYPRQHEVAPGDTVQIAAQADPATDVKWRVDRLAFRDATTKIRYASGDAELKPQATPAPHPKTGLVEAKWPTAFGINVGADWPAGIYIVTLERGKHSTRAFFVVNDRKPHDFLYQVSLSTYAAYNAWGGLSVYANNTGLPLERAYQVSLDRPLHNGGLGDLLWLEQPLILWLTRAGYDVGYTTNPGIELEPRQLEKTKMLILSGHDEYWSALERSAVDDAVARGMHLTSLSANTAYWRINYRPAWDGRPARVIECGKIGPFAEATGTRLWRLEGTPEGALLGSQFGWILDSWAPLIIGDTDDPLFEGTSLQTGEQFFGLMGPEVDGHYADSGSKVLAYAPVVDVIERVNTATVTVRRTASGAQVFNASGNFWSSALHGPYAHWKLQRLLANVMAAAGKPKITPHHSPGYEISGVQRWLSSAVTTMSVVPAGPRSIVDYGGSLLFTTAAENTIYRLAADGSYTPFTEPAVRIDALATTASGELYGISLLQNGLYKFDGQAFVRLNAAAKGLVDGPLATAQFADPVQLTADGDDLVVVEHHRTDSRIRRISGGVVKTLKQPGFVVFTALPLADGSLLTGLADNRLWRLKGDTYTHFAGSIPAGWNDANYMSARFVSPYGIRPAPGGFMVLERYGHRIRYVSAEGGAWTVAGAGAGYVDGRGDLAKFRLPFAMAWASERELVVTDAGNSAIRKVTLFEYP